MRQYNWKKWLSIGLAFLLFVLAGCQAIGSVDLNKALMSMFEIKSMEGSGTIALEFTFDETAKLSGADAEELAILKLLNHTKLNFTSIKQESAEKASISGTLEISRGKIPFAASITPDSIVFKPEGAAKPFVLDLKSLSSLQDAALIGNDDSSVVKLIDSLQKKLKDTEFMKPIRSFFVGKLPNPKNVKLDSVNETINGESVPLYKVQAEMNGKELIPWFKSLILALMQDDQGLKAVIAQFYDALQPELKAALGGSASAQDESLGSLSPSFDLGFLDTIGSLLDDRDTAIEFLHTEVKQVLVILLAVLNGTDKEGIPVDDLLNEQSYVRTNLYFDHDLRVRKSDAEIVITPHLENNGGISAVKLTSSTVNWNVNKPVKADLLPATDGLDFGQSPEPAKLIDNLDKNSVLYQWLRKDLHLMRKTVRFDTELSPYMPPEMRTYVENDTTMVPARYLAEQLGATIEWDDAKQILTIKDSQTGAEISMSVGEKRVYVGSKTVELDTPAKLTDGTVYVPLRFIAESLGAQVKWDEAAETIIVTRE